MWMTDYICAIKRQWRDVYGFAPTGGSEHDPTFDKSTIPDGTYPMTIDGKVDNVELIDGKIHCCNFKKEDDPVREWKRIRDWRNEEPLY